LAFERLMVSVSGVRGRVADGLTPEVVVQFAGAFGAWSIGRAAQRGAKASRSIVVGRDSRVSGPMFHRAAVAALQSVGAHVIDLGLTTTPTCQLAVEHHHAAGGLMLSASHNPIEWNALKFIGPTGLFLEAEEGAAMRALLEPDAEIPRATWDQLGDIISDDTAMARHIDAVLALSCIDVAGIRARKFHVALDTCRGAGGAIIPALLERLGCRVSAINLETDGRFPRPPEPVAENLGELERLVASTGAVVGFAVDPDVDRLALVADGGRAIGEDWTLALASRVVLRAARTHAGREGNGSGTGAGVVVTNLSTSRIIDDVASEAGARVIRAPVGEVNVAVRMRREGAVVGGEGNGGVILPELHLGRDAPVAVALVLQLLHEAGQPLSKIVAEYPRYSIVKDKLDRPDVSLAEVYDALRAGFPDAEVDTQDGLRLSWPDRWVHVRPSGTEPIVRVIAEAPSEEAARTLVSRSRAPLEALVG
jgi:phosphomannomutase